MAYPGYHFKLRLKKDLEYKPAPLHTISSALEKFSGLVDDGYSLQTALKLASEGLPEHFRNDFKACAEEKYSKMPKKEE